MNFDWKTALALAGLQNPGVPGFDADTQDQNHKNEKAERQAELQDQTAERADRMQERQNREEELYDRGTEAMDESRWDRAVESFGRVAEMKGRRADGSLYWKAYAQNKLGQRSEALATLGVLVKAYSQSRWNKDAKALQVEIQQAAGHPVSPDTESNEDLKLMAINGLLSSDPDRALPLLEKILLGNQSLKVKERALFVLAQSGSPKARDIMAQLARGQGNPDLQKKAIRNMGLFGGTESRKLLSEIYASSSDLSIKKTIIQSLFVGGERGLIFDLAKNEKNPELRIDAIRQLGIMGGQEELWQIYQAEPSVGVKAKILQSMFVGGNVNKLADVARSEKSPELRRAAIHSLGLMGGKKTGEILVSIYSTDKDPEVRHTAINGLFIQGNAKALVELARRENDPGMKKEIVSKLSLMGSKEAMEYMMEILNK